MKYDCNDYEYVRMIRKNRVGRGHGNDKMQVLLAGIGMRTSMINGN